MSAFLRSTGLQKRSAACSRRRRLLRRRRRRAAGADRPQRRRQEHLLQHAERPAPPDAGRCRSRRDIRAAPRAIWRPGVGRTFQITATFASMSVRENVQMALCRTTPASCARAVAFGAAISREADALLAQVGMLDQAERACGVLAYGDLKRVELAMALANQPSCC
jgi:ABC-type branched-subunit amino acid transport system ATPase component